MVAARVTGRSSGAVNEWLYGKATCHRRASPRSSRSACGPCSAEEGALVVTNDYRALAASAREGESVLIATSCSRYDRARIEGPSSSDPNGLTAMILQRLSAVPLGGALVLHQPRQIVHLVLQVSEDVVERQESQ